MTVEREEMSSVFQGVRICPEDARGVVPAGPTTLLQSLSFKPSVKFEADAFGTEGSKYDVLSIPKREWSEWSISGKPVFDELPFLFSAGISFQAPTTPDGATNTRLWTFKSLPRAIDAIKTLFIEQGSGTRWQRASFGLVAAWNAKFARTGIDISGSMLAQEIDFDHRSSLTSAVYTLTFSPWTETGTFTITVDAQTTTAIAYNATADAVVAALEALSTVGAGDVVVTKGTLSYVISFVNGMADKAVTVTASYTSLSPVATRIVFTAPNSGGTYVLSLDGDDTSDLAFDANAAAVKAALGLLTGFTVDDWIVTGSHTTGFLIQCIDATVVSAATAAATLLSATYSALTPTGTGTTTTVGIGTTAVTQTGAAPNTIDLVPVTPSSVDVYMADTYAGLDSAEALDRTFTFEIDTSGRVQTLWPLKSGNMTYSFYVEAKPKVTGKMSMAMDALARVHVGTMRTGATKYFRLLAVGDEIETGFNYYWKIDCAAKITNVSGPADASGVFASDFDFSLVADDDLDGGPFIIEVQCKLTEL